MSVRSWISIITVIVIGLIVFFSWHEIERAWRLLGQVNLWIFALVIPLQIMSYFAAGEMVFSYLRRKGMIKQIKPLKLASMALEMNFVNHTLPSGGVSGISYMTWRLGHYGVSPARATAAQLVRVVAGFGSFILLLLIALAFITLDGSINRGVLFISGLIVFTMFAGTTLLVYVVGSLGRIEKFGKWVTQTVNRIVRTVTFGRRKWILRRTPIIAFLSEMHDEYMLLRRERQLLIKPVLWGLLFTVVDVAIFVVTFWALGSFVSPAPILIAYGMASIAGFIVVTPGGAGAYEAIMVSFLATAGVPADVAIAGIILARVAILLGTIVFGYVFYQHTLVRHGKSKPKI